MKIGIITFQRAYNYGAVLQAYALCKTLNELGYTCEVIDYHNARFENDYRKITVLKSKSLREFVSALVHGKTRNAKRKAFIDFVESEVGISRKEYFTDNIKEANSEYEVFITGSDQVWNFDLSGNDETYLLKFIPEKDKKGAYAPSIGKTELTESEYSKLQAIKDFGYLSARENTASDIIENITGNKPVLVPDPVFLLSKEEWREKEEKYKGIPEKYVLIYKFADNDKKMTQFAYDYAKRNNCEIVIVQSSLKNADGAKVVRDASPGEFLWLIDNAQCVVTNSFHGTAFSILFGKEFYSNK